MAAPSERSTRPVGLQISAAPIASWRTATLVARNRLHLAAMPRHFIADDRDGRHEHEDNKANRHIDAGKRRNDGERRDGGGPDQQPNMEEIERSRASGCNRPEH